MQLYQNFLIVLKFLGTNYHGWQIQSNAISVQKVFQDALFKITKSEVDIKGCSRTDSGVHANAYCVSAKIGLAISERGLTLALNSNLPCDIRVTGCIKVNDDFHARYSCLAKEYIYLLYNHEILDPFLYGRCLHFWYPLDINLMNELSQIFVGMHNFASFCSDDNREKINMERNIHYFNIHKQGNIVKFVVKADGFLYNMVRIMVGTILNANYKKMNAKDILNIINARDRAFAGPTIPPHGLYLNKVFYKEFII